MKNLSKKNSLNTIRLLAAIQVMYGHLIHHLKVADLYVGGISIQQSLSKVLNFFPGVPIFFFISGFLLLRTVLETESLSKYAYKRIIRLYPELWIAVAIEIISIVIFYFNKIKWGILAIFAGTQATVFQFWTPDFLRGYGCGTPNGSLWTIVIFVQFYILIWLSRNVYKKISFSIWMSIEVLFVLVGLVSTFVERAFPEIIVKLYYETIIPYLWIFWMGMLVSRYWKYISRVLLKWWFLLLVAYIGYWVIGKDITIGRYPFISTLITSLGCIGIAFRFPSINIKLDISYELYILHMIIVNVLITLGIMGVTGLEIALITTVFLSMVLHYLNVKLIRKIGRHV